MAAQIAPLVSFHATSKMHVWVNFLIADCSQFTVYNLLWTRSNTQPKLSKLSMLHFLCLWDSVKYSSGLISSHLPLSGILVILQFIPALENLLTFEWWHMQCVKYAYSIYPGWHHDGAPKHQTPFKN